MQPAQLRENDFQRYPPKARKLATGNLPLLRLLPLGFAPFLLKEVILYDWKFPAEQRELDWQMTYLNAMTPANREEQMRRFAALTLNEKLAALDWVNAPAQFLEQLSAHLWATHQMDEFRSASEDYVHKLNESMSVEPLPTARLGVVLIGQGVNAGPYPLFRKLRRQGVHFTNVDATDGFRAIVQALRDRAEAHPSPYSHWQINGGKADALSGFASVSYDALTPARNALAAKMLSAYEAPKFDPEQLRTTLAQTTVETLGMRSSGDSIMDRFALSLLTEGSGTQIYSTTFVRWGAREAIRRAQPLTLYVRYAPRQKERSMDELLAGATGLTQTDAEGSLIDADMGAYYTWLNQQRLSEAAKARFLVWFEGQKQAVAIGPGLAKGTVYASAITMPALLQLMRLDNMTTGKLPLDKLIGRDVRPAAVQFTT